MSSFTRDMQLELINMSKSYPVVTVLGPRQSGKSTLVRNTFPNKAYVSLEDIDERTMAEIDPRGFLKRYVDGAILDEIQRAPFLLSYIQGIVDRSEIKGLYILTGSHQLELHESSTQSLAGRTAILKLLPLSISELKKGNIDLTLDEYLYSGMYPRIYKDGLNPTKFYRDYVQTYVERDVRKMINVKDLSLFQRFLKLCASRVGQVFNSSSMGNELGINYHTINNWISILEASFLIFKLEPYFENFGKRLIKSAKIYFTDVGLAAYLLDITSPSQISRDPLRGSLVENLVISEFKKERLNVGSESAFYFYRDSNQKEVDLILKIGNELIPIEIKSSQTFQLYFISSLQYFMKISKRSPFSILIYAGDKEQTMQNIKICNFKHIKELINSIYITT